MDSEVLKYGIGIVSDLTEISLSTRVFEEKSITIKSSFGIIDGNNITISGKTKGVVELDLQCTEDSTRADIEIYIESGAEIIIHEKAQVQDLLVLTLNLYVGSNAKVQYVIDQQTEEDKYILVQRYAHVEKNASLEWVDIELGGKISKSELHTHLLEPGARGETYGIFYGRDKQVFDLYNVVHHAGSHTTSTMDVRGVLDDSSKGIYRGLIRIPKGSYSCDGAQSEKTLMLSRNAQISSVPDLEIENNDVKCSHAVSTTHIDPTSLFYLQSRGLSIIEAGKIVVESHIKPIIDRITDESLQVRFLEQVMKKYL